jgi:hypothetical protein
MKTENSLNFNILDSVVARRRDLKLRRPAKQNRENHL